MDSPWRPELYSPSSSFELATYQVLDPELTRELATHPYNPEIWLNRAYTLHLIGFPELILGDTYKSRLIIEAALSLYSSPLSYSKVAFQTFSDKYYAMQGSNLT
ncbi:hypothetical protein BJ878DRAFT_481424 [Calycina marina]|uniref:Uncharacterized protein n=1 Tax=Calycina marina TaxID=1763456 RepID=A0A9P7Z0G4_9HELO|nr:hypothetical protein BJ878DRAFT_481424 [Calycina marina]